MQRTRPASSDYVQTFRANAAATGQRTSEEWLRLIFEDVPWPVRVGLRAGWRYGLGLRLAPPDMSGQVAGWRVARTEPDVTRITAAARTLDAALTLTRPDAVGDAVALTSEVGYRTVLGHVLWSVALPAHRVIAPYLLRRACRPQAATAS